MGGTSRRCLTRLNRPLLEATDVVRTEAVAEAEAGGDKEAGRDSEAKIWKEAEAGGDKEDSQVSDQVRY